MELKIVKVGKDPTKILRENLTSLKTTPAEVRGYKLAMEKACRKNNGIGVAANQVGLRHNMFLIMPEAGLLKGSKAAELCIRPYHTLPDDAEPYMTQEGCMSIPGRRFNVHRFWRINASWTNVQGHLVERSLTAKAAQVFQHEYDHLCGKTLIEAGRDVLEPADTSGNIIMPTKVADTSQDYRTIG